MLKTLKQSDKNDCKNLKCGEVYYLGPKTYHVECIVCNERIVYQMFPRHFRVKHLENGWNINILDDLESTVIEAVAKEINLENEEDPIKHESKKSRRSERVLQKIARIEREIVVDGEDIKEKQLAKCEEKTEVCMPKLDLLVENKTKTIVTDIKFEFIADDIITIEKNYNEILEENEKIVDWKLETLETEDFLQNTIDSVQDVEEKQSSYSCHICERNYASKRAITQHLRNMHNPDKKKKLEKPQTFKCDQCEEVFRFERELRGHKWKHTGIVCEICGRPFTQVGNLMRHKIRHTGIKEFKCKECQKEFFTDKELKSHMICHTGRMPVICEICAKPCRDRGVLTAHMRRHTGERPAKCEHCGKSFFSQHDLNVHAVAHTDERPFKCDICAATFQRKKALRVHKKLHNKDRPHVCDICGKGFAVASGLTAHLRSHDATNSKIAVITAPIRECIEESDADIID